MNRGGEPGGSRGIESDGGGGAAEGGLSLLLVSLPTLCELLLLLRRWRLLLLLRLRLLLMPRLLLLLPLVLQWLLQMLGC